MRPRTSSLPPCETQHQIFSDKFIIPPFLLHTHRRLCKSNKRKRRFSWHSIPHICSSFHIHISPSTLPLFYALPQHTYFSIYFYLYTPVMKWSRLGHVRHSFSSHCEHIRPRFCVTEWFAYLMGHESARTAAVHSRFRHAKNNSLVTVPPPITYFNFLTR